MSIVTTETHANLYVQGCWALCVWFIFVYDWQKNIFPEYLNKKWLCLVIFTCPRTS